jgi:hypothetical protein
MSEIRLTVPVSARQFLVKIVEQDEASAKQFREGLAQVGPSASVSDLADRLAPLLGEPADELRELLTVLASMIQTLERVEASVSDFADGVVNSMQRLELGDLEYSAELKKLAARRISDYLNSKALFLTGKAIELAMSYDAVYADCRIISDFRPLFSEGTDPSPVYGVITHNLAIEVHGDAGHEKHYFALNSTDLDDLRTAIERALKKDQKLREMGRIADIGVLTGEPREKP